MDPKSDDLSGMKILVVDDVPTNIALLSGTLKTKNYQIFTAESGTRTLEITPELQPDLILLDIMMPGENGIETCKKLKTNELTRDIPIIFVTAKGTDEDILEGFNAGGVDYILKPYRLQEVLARVETHLRLKKSIRDKDNLISELKDTQEVLMNSAKKDLLTALWNRPGLEAKLFQEQLKGQTTEKVFSLILADIDHIGKINDEFGISIGDQVIIRTASLLTDTLRPYDHVGRWSSEEFLILLPETELKDSKILGEKIRIRIENEILDFNQSHIPLTLSMGVNQCSPDMQWNKCLIETQECLRRAKALGRNQLVAPENA